MSNTTHTDIIRNEEVNVSGSNKTRYRARKEAAKSYWLEHKPTGTALAARFGVSFCTGCRWIREWKAETP